MISKLPLLPGRELYAFQVILSWEIAGYWHIHYPSEELGVNVYVPA